jgi:hypothetical protein
MDPHLKHHYKNETWLKPLRVLGQVTEDNQVLSANSEVGIQQDTLVCSLFFRGRSLDFTSVMLIMFNDCETRNKAKHSNNSLLIPATASPPRDGVAIFDPLYNRRTGDAARAHATAARAADQGARAACLRLAPHQGPPLCVSVLLLSVCELDHATNRYAQVGFVLFFSKQEKERKELEQRDKRVAEKRRSLGDTQVRVFFWCALQ